ncbi:MAG: hypothetical protein ACRYGP_13430 [Janthinobacterium lividum]
MSATLVILVAEVVIESARDDVTDDDGLGLGRHWCRPTSRVVRDAADDEAGCWA